MCLLSSRQSCHWLCHDSSGEVQGPAPMLGVLRSHWLVLSPCYAYCRPAFSCFCCPAATARRFLLYARGLPRFHRAVPPSPRFLLRQWLPPLPLAQGQAVEKRAGAEENLGSQPSFLANKRSNAYLGKRAATTHLRTYSFTIC